jgi:glutathione S-transferase
MPLTIYGNYFDNDTRSLTTMLAIVGQTVEVKIIDIFKGDHTKAEFLQISPCSTLPLVVDGNFKVLGSTHVFVNYLANAKPKLQKLYPTEKKAEIQSHLNWFESVLKPSAKRLTGMIVGPKAFG